MKSVMLAAALLLASMNVWAEDDGRDKLIRELLVMTNALDISSQVYEQLKAALAPRFPSVPAKVWDDVGKSLKTERFEQLMIALYKEQFTEEELQAMHDFYSTPEGKSIIQKLPALNQRSIQLGMAWGQQEAAKIVATLKDKGYEPVAL